VGTSLVRSSKMPQAICDVPPGDEATFLAPLPVTSLWSVDPKTAEKLAELGIHTIGNIAAWPAADLARRARGIDDRPIVTERDTKSIWQETTFARDVTGRALLERTLREQADEIAQKLRREDLMGTTVKLKIRWPDFTTPTRQLTLPQPTDEPEAIIEAALRLFGQIWTGEQAVRLIGVGVSGLGSPPRQLNLWDAPPAPTPEQIARQQRVEAALAAIQARFGVGAVRRGSELGEQ
jgi:DNA polymerase IV